MMRRRRRKQRVVLRSKVRRERFDKIWSFLFGKFAVALLLAAFAAGAHRFLFVSNFFMIKSLQVSDADPKIASELKSRVARFKGKSALRLDLDGAERDALKQYPQLSSLTIKRVLPDGVTVDYTLRKAVALLRTPPQPHSEKSRALGQALALRSDGPLSAMDPEGVLFPADLQQAGVADLPEAVVPASQDRHRALAFLAAWKDAETKLAQGGDPLTLHKLTLDSWNELNLYIRSAAFPGENTRIVWGVYDAATFEEKYQRLREVWRDLLAKSMTVEYVNLRGVPQRVPSVLGEREVVGRVIVRPKVKVTQAVPKSNLKG